MITWTEDDLERIAHPTEAEIDACIESWLRHAPKEYRGIIIAQEGRSEGNEEDEDKRFLWVTAAGFGKFYDRLRKRFLDPLEVRLVLDSYIESVEKEIAADDTIPVDNVASWQMKMKDTVVMLHRVAAFIAIGGVFQIKKVPRIHYIVKDEVVKHLSHLSAFARDIEEKRLISLGWFKARSRLYARAIRRTYEQVRRKLAHLRQRGGIKVEERRVRHANESCKDCIEYANRGWQPLGTLPPLGDSACGPNCLCTFEFRTVPQTP